MKLVALAACAIALSGGAGSALAQEPNLLDVSVAPRTALFGDPVEIRAEVVFDGDLADPRGVELADPDFGPFEVGETRRETAQGAELHRVSYLIELECLTARCLPREGARERRLDLPPLHVRIAGEGGERELEAPLPQVRIATRLSPREVREEDGWSYDDRSVPAASYRIPLGVAIAVLSVAAVALALISGALAVYAATGRTPRSALAARRATALERALALARGAASAEPEERRKALERLARELGRSGHPELSERSGTLAWSRPEPSESAITALVADAQRAVAGAGG